MKIPLSAILPGHASEACCTCASVLTEVPSHSPQTEKPYPAGRKAGCCSRVICGRCIHNNSRFASYCPYCQVASEPSGDALPQGLRDPPPYDVAATTTMTTTTTTSTPDADAEAPPPPYTSTCSPTSPTPPHPTQDPKPTKSDDATPPSPPPLPQDTLHFVHPAEDTIATLSIQYNVPPAVLRSHNRLPSDHLLPARRAVLIPASHYPSGVSLRPRPAGGEEEEARRAKVRRWMVGCRCADYDVAELYLGQAGYDLDLAVGRYLDDERWERENPFEAGKGKGKGKGKAKEKGTTGGTWAARAASLWRQGPS